MKLPPLRAVQYFEVVARLLSFSRAALELNVSQSAVSHQIRLLEDFLGERLLLRQGRLLSLTPQGEIYFEGIAAGLVQIAQSSEQLRGGGEMRVRLAVWLAGEALSRQKVLTALLGFVGVLIVLRPTEVNWAALAALGVALSLAVNNLLIKRIPLQQPIAQTLFFTNVLSMPFILALAWWEGGEWQWQMWWPAFGSSALIMVYAGLCVMAYRKAEASKIASAEYTGLLMAVAIGVWLFDEQPGLPLLLGCLCIILPLVAMARSKPKPQAEPAL